MHLAIGIHRLGQRVNRSYTAFGLPSTCRAKGAIEQLLTPPVKRAVGVLAMGVLVEPQRSAPYVVRGC